MTKKIRIIFLCVFTFSMAQLVSSTLWAAENGKAIFAAGCFWCIEKDFEKYEKEGIVSVVSGYTGGAKANPTYEQVSAGDSGHLEVVEVTYDPKKISSSFYRDFSRRCRGGCRAKRHDHRRGALAQAPLRPHCCGEIYRHHIR